MTIKGRNDGEGILGRPLCESRKEEQESLD